MEQREVEEAIQKENMNNATVAQEEYSVSHTIQYDKYKQFNVNILKPRREVLMIRRRHFASE
jgi:hypothetical protein